eukprot:4570847-Pyramimonas_sp.AAC.1
MICNSYFKCDREDTVANWNEEVSEVFGKGKLYVQELGLGYGTYIRHFNRHFGESRANIRHASLSPPITLCL